MLQANYSAKIWPYFSMGYNFKCHKNTFYGLTILPPVRISKSISGEVVLSSPPWPVFLIKFAQNQLLECKQLRDAGGHPEYIISRAKADSRFILVFNFLTKLHVQLQPDLRS